MGVGAFSREVHSVPGAVSQTDAQSRTAFLRRTYTHLAAAIFAFVGLEYLLLNSEMGYTLTSHMLGRGSWAMVLIAFMVVGWIADKWARSDASPGVQYLGLALYVVAEVVIFCPLLFLATVVSEQPNIVPTAGVLTLLMFGGLTATVFITKKDFSFLRGALGIASFGALGLIFAGMLFGFNLGLFFSVAMVGLASGYVLYYTSNLIHHYRPNQHVAASLALFSAIALMFWYVVRILMSRD
jgi:FtsH-binding integral membrane protein